VKILHLLASPVFTGPADQVAQLALAQRALGHQVSVAIDARRTDLTSEELAAPRLRALDLLDDGDLELSVKSSPLAMLRDAARLRRRSVDIVHCHFSHDHALAWLGQPRNSHLVRSVHAPRSLRWSTPWADAWTIPMDALSRRLLGKPVMVLPPLVADQFVPHPDRAGLRAQLGLPTQGPLIGLVSTFQPSRRHDLALQAFALVAARQPAAHLVLVGDGALGPQLKAQALTLGLSGRTHFVGYQSGPAFVRYLQALDEVWLLGLGNDFSGRAAAQARACGVRVVSVDEGGLPRSADQLVDRDAASLAAAALSGERRAVTLEDATSIARRVVELYEAARRTEVGP
jgi:glycosyltransferase involved in cell wall biosynthesis